MMSAVVLRRGGAVLIGGLALAGTLILSTGSAEAQRWRRPYYAPGAAIGLGIAGGLIAGSVIAGAARPAPIIVDDPVEPIVEERVVERECWTERRRVWDGYGYVRERVRVCER